MVNWSDAVDFEQAKKNIRLEYPGDWYRDPWTRPEIDWLVDREPHRIIERLDSEESSIPAKVDVAKENFSIRPAVVLVVISENTTSKAQVTSIRDVRPIRTGPTTT